MSQYKKDLLERTLWTLAQVVVGAATVYIADLDYWWILPISTGLAFVKGIVAKKIGNADSASTVPSI